MEDFKIRVAFSRSKYIGDAIRLCTGGDVNHAFLIHFDPVYGVTLALGANANGFTPDALASFPDEIVRVYQPVGIDLLTGLRKAIAAGMLDEEYDFAGLLGMSVVEVAAHLERRIIKNPFLDKHKIFCSEAVAKIVRWSPLASKPSGASYFDVLAQVPAGSVDPYELDRAVLASPYFKLDPEWASGGTK